MYCKSLPKQKGNRTQRQHRDASIAAVLVDENACVGGEVMSQSEESDMLFMIEMPMP